MFQARIGKVGTNFSLVYESDEIGVYSSGNRTTVAPEVLVSARASQVTIRCAAGHCNPGALLAIV
jgi:hypothetical protein